MGGPRRALFARGFAVAAEAALGSREPRRHCSGRRSAPAVPPRSSRRPAGAGGSRSPPVRTPPACFSHRHCWPDRPPPAPPPASAHGHYFARIRRPVRPARLRFVQPAICRREWWRTRDDLCRLGQPGFYAQTTIVGRTVGPVRWTGPLHDGRLGLPEALPQSPRQPLVTEPLRLIGRNAEALPALLFVGLKIAFAPVDVAVAFEGQYVCGEPVEEPAIVADDHHAAGVVENRLF